MATAVLATLGGYGYARSRDVEPLRIDDVPLAEHRRVALVVTERDPFSPDVRIERAGTRGGKPIPMPPARYYAGHIDGEPGSWAVIAETPAGRNGLVMAAEGAYLLGSAGVGGGLVGREVSHRPADGSAPAPTCGTPRLPDAGRVPLVDGPSVARSHAGGTPHADVAVETDRELRLAFPSDEAMIAWVGSLFAAVGAIYARDLGVEMQVSYLRVWGPSPADPWTATDPVAALDEFRDYWNDPRNDMDDRAGSYDLAHFLSGKPVLGGAAHVDALCHPVFGFGLSQVVGAFDLAAPSQVWDVLVVAHELGHGFGSEHTHCYDPPIDHCFNLEEGCWSGAVSPSRGELMSYCHLFGGTANVDLEFGSRVAARIGSRVRTAHCLEPVTTTTTTSSTTSTSTGGPTTTTTSTTHGPRASTTTSSSVPPPPDGDADGVPDAFDRCAATPASDLVLDDGCSPCPCGGVEGRPWRSRGEYVRCMKQAVHGAVTSGHLGSSRGAALLWAARAATCGKRGATRCCVGTGMSTRCRVLRAHRCAGTDLGAGTCRPNPC